MLQNLSEEIRDCLRRAEECKRLSKKRADPICDQGLSRHGAALAGSGPQLRICRAAVEFHRPPVQQGRAAQEIGRLKGWLSRP
jgi:hypothetical protein